MMPTHSTPTAFTWREPRWAFKAQSPSAMRARVRPVPVWGLASACVLWAALSVGLFIYYRLLRGPQEWLVMLFAAIGLPVLALAMKFAGFWYVPPLVSIDSRKGIGLQFGKQFCWCAWKDMASVELLTGNNNRSMLRVGMPSRQAAVGVGDKIDRVAMKKLLAEKLGSRFAVSKPLTTSPLHHAN